MIKNTLKSINENIILFSTISIIVIAYFLYYFIIQQHNEERLVDQAQRELDQIALNIKKKEKAYWKNVINSSEFINTWIQAEIDSTGENSFKKNNLIFSNIQVEEINSGSNAGYELFKKLKNDRKQDTFNTILDDKKAFLNEENITPLFRYNSFEKHLFISGTGEIYASDFQTGIDFDLKKWKSLIKLDSLNSPHIKLNINSKNYFAFTRPVDLATGQKVFLIGLISEKNFNAAKRKSDLWLIIVLSFLAVIAIVHYPLLKLWLRNEFEGLDFSHILSSAISIIFGSSFILLLALGLIALFGFKESKKTQLKDLNKKIESTFRAELSRAYELLEYTDSIENIELSAAHLDSVIKNKKYPFFNNVYWIDNSGVQLHEINLSESDPVLIELKDRTYFKEYDEWLLPNSNGKENINWFRLESIVSWTSNQKKAALSKPSHRKTLFDNYTTEKDEKVKAKVVALTFSPYSVMNTILPAFFSFAIIDDEGKVLFHNDKSKNINENLLFETENNKLLKSAIDARVNEQFNGEYQGEDYLFYISPIDNLPLHVVTMYNLEEQRTLISGIISTSFIMLSVFAFVLLFSLLLVYLVRGTIFPKQIKHAHSSYLLHWLVPRKSHNEKYIRLTISTLVAGLFLIVYYFYFDKEPVRLLFGFIILEIIVFNNFAFDLKKLKIKDLFSRSFGSYVYTSIAIVVILTAIYYKYFKSFDVIILSLILILSLKIIHYILKKRFEQTDETRFKHNFFQMLFCWLLTISIVPSILIFDSVTYKEFEIHTIGHQKFIESEFIKKTKTTYNEQNMLKYQNHSNFVDSLQVYGNYISAFADTITISQKKEEEPQPKEIKNSSDIWTNHQTLYEKIRPLFFDNNTSTKYLSYYLKNAPANVSQTNKELILFKHPTNDSIAVDEATINFKPVRQIFGNFLRNNFFVVPLIFVILILSIVYYYLIRYTSLNIFVFDRFRAITNLTSDQFLSKIDKLTKYIFLINPSQEIIDTSQNKKIKEIDIKNLCDNPKILKSINNQYKYLFVKNFNTYWSDITTLSQFVTVLKKAIEKTGLKIIISSVYTPKQINEFYDESSFTPDELIRLKASFNNIISKFAIVYISISNCPEDDKETLTEKRELAINNHLSQFLNLININKEKHNELEEDVILDKIKVYANEYYYNLWDKCSLDEKFLLFDLAKDGFVNFKNHYSLEQLLEKGLIVHRNNRLTLMNKSFSRFIINSLGSKELERMTKELKRKGGWIKIRLPIILVIISFILFVFLSQQNLITSLNAILASAAALVGILLNLSKLLAPK